MLSTFGGSSTDPLEHAYISGGSIAMSNSSGSNFHRVVAVDTNFGGMKQGYSFSEFKDATLINASFWTANLTGSDFTGANVSGVNFSNANLYETTGINFNEVSSVCNAIMPDGSIGKCK